VFLDANSNPLSGGSVYFYIPNTTTPKTTWQDATGSVANSNPVVLDGNGSALIYGSGQYTQKVFDSLGNLVYTALTQDPYGQVIGGNNTFTGTNTFTGSTYAVTQATGNQSQLLATTQFVANSIGSIDVRSYGAVPDCRRLTDITATSGSPNITSGGLAAFTQADVGKIINLYDFTNNNYVFRGTLASVTNATTAALSGNAGNSLASANCIGYIGTDNSIAIKNAIAQANVNLSPVSQGPNLSLGGGNQVITFPSSPVGNMYAFATPQVFNTNMTIDADAMLVPMCGSATTNVQGQANRIFPLILMPGVNIRNLQTFNNYTMCAVLGTYTQQSHSRIDQFTSWDVGNTNQSGSIACTANVNSGGSLYAAGDTITLTGGTGTKAVVTVLSVSAGVITAAYISTPGNYSVLPSNPVAQGSTSGSGTGASFNISFSNNSHIGLDVNGNDTFINQYWVKNGNIGLHLNQANDVMINHLFLIGCSTGLQAAGCEEVQIATCQIDTGSFAGITIDSSHTFRLAGGNAFSINATGLTYGIGIGQNDGSNPCRNMVINSSFYRCGGDALRLGNCADSRFWINATNAALFDSSGVAITNAVNFTGAATPTGDIVIDLTVGTTGTGTITPFTGTGYGMALLNGNPNYSVQVPINGFSITIDNSVSVLIVNPAGSLSTGTITMAAIPMDGMVATIASTNTVTTLTHSPNTGQTLKNALTTLASGTTAKWTYQLSSKTWFRTQ
jgi:hypothetical protein